MTENATTMENWVKQTIISMGQQEVPEMLVSYITLMIDNKKSISEIRDELVELLGDDESKLFADALDAKLNGGEAAQVVPKASSDPAAVVSKPSDNVKSTKSDESSDKRNRSRRDHDQSSRAERHERHGKVDNSSNERDRGVSKRGRDARDMIEESRASRGDFNRDKRSRQQSQQIPPNQRQQNPNPNPNGRIDGHGGGGGGGVRGSGNNLQQNMENMAQMSGFYNAQQMVAASQEMMLAMMSGQMSGGRGDGERFGGRGDGGRFGGRGGASQGRGAGRGFAGRFDSGRGGRGRGHYAVVEKVPEKALNPEEKAQQESEAKARAAHPMYADAVEDNMSGRGRGRGRGGRGRGMVVGRGGRGRGRVVINEDASYVRPDVNKGLNASR